MVVSGSGTRPGSLKNILDEEHQQKHRLIRERTGTGSIPGSLNLSPQRPLFLDRSRAIELPYGPFFLARIRGVGVVFRPFPVPERQSFRPPTRLLVYSDQHLRNTLVSIPEQNGSVNRWNSPHRWRFGRRLGACAPT